MKENMNSTNYVFEGVDTVELAKTYGTPLYVISEDMVRKRCREIKTNFINKYSNTKAAYASKAFLTKEMCKIIKEEGLGLDVVSGGELYTALMAEFPMKDVMFHGNNKSYKEIEMAVENSVGRIVADNMEELDIIDSIAIRLNKKVRVLIRITPGVKGNTHDYISTGQTDSKFGIPLDYIDKAVEKSLNSSNLELMGFHFHIGSNLFENEPYIKAIETVMKFYKELEDKFSFTAKELDTGGGFGIFYTDNDDVKPIKYYTDCIMETVQNCCEELNIEMPDVIIEPGRWIVGEAGITLYTIGAVKEIPNIRTYISIDGGLPDNPRPALYDAKYSAIVANKFNIKPDRIVTVAGKCCESSDILIKDLNVPEIKTGDILAVLSTGAYNYSMASNYNRLPRPAVVMLHEGKHRLIVKRETYDDLLKNEI